ncbi:MAG TPA: pacearchaeosortase [Candidatus Nanoarchaeia archaeon]|nr:pacearchaeosortase [Candidatus Nanoarchaeia archaeon]
MDVKEVLGLVSRYFILFLIAIFNISIFYDIFTPITVHAVFLALKNLYSAQLLEGNIIFFKGYYANILPACVAGAAYYLLLILNLTTPMHIGKRIKSLIFLMFSFWIINTLRIIIFAMIVFVGYQYFDIAHMLAWYIGSTVLVVGVWFANVWLFKIQAIPIYTDALNILRDVAKDGEKSK